jgi:hypothetical protein
MPSLAVAPARGLGRSGVCEARLRSSLRAMHRFVMRVVLLAVTLVDTFSGTFVRVRRRNGREVLGAFTQGRVIGTLAIPAVPVCE